jgi:outer membrane lipoprotein SlyB
MWPARLFLVLLPNNSGVSSVRGSTNTNRKINMQEQANKSLHPLIWIAGIAVILFSVAGIAAIMGWIPASKGMSDNAALAKIDKPAENIEKPAAATVDTAPSKNHTALQRVADGTPAQAKCVECGVIESVREVNQRGESSGVGVVGGAVVGGLLGNQIGGGHGNQAATVLGALGGAVVGNEIEHRAKSTKIYEITVRFEDGSTSVIKEANPAGWRPGDRVKVINGVIRSNN